MNWSISVGNIFFFFFLTWSGFKHSQDRCIFVAILCQSLFKCHLRVTYQSQDSVFILFTFIDFKISMGTLLWRKAPSAKSYKHLLIILMRSLIIKFVDVIQYKGLGFTRTEATSHPCIFRLPPGFWWDAARRSVTSSWSQRVGRACQAQGPHCFRRWPIWADSVAIGQIVYIQVATAKNDNMLCI